MKKKLLLFELSAANIQIQKKTRVYATNATLQIDINLLVLYFTVKLHRK